MSSILLTNMSTIELLVILFHVNLLMFILKSNNFLFLFLFSETTWLALYCLSVNYGVLNDDLLLLTMSFFILGLATVEFVIGYILIILFKKINLNLNFEKTETTRYLYFYQFSKVFNLTKINWNLKN